MRIRIDYLNNEREKQARHAFYILHDHEFDNNCELLWLDIRDILKNWWTDLHIYKL
jgi:hypothetical protein